VTIRIKATVGAGSAPVIAFTEYPLVFTQSATSEILSADVLKTKMTATDAEDGDWSDRRKL
jgi:hypothetical protein